MNFARVLLVLSVVSNVVAYIIYLYLIFRNKIKPHAITYLVWFIILSVNFLIQLKSGVGAGSILIFTNLTGCLIVFTLSWIKKNIAYDKIDWICFALAIFTVVLWLVTKTPIYSVVLSCIIDALALTPSFRKSYYKPREDSALTFTISGLEYLFSLPSYGVLTVVVLLYPVFVLCSDFAYATFMLIRRRQLK